MDGADVPIERLTQNIQRQIEANPMNAKAYYVLARVHSLAYARGGGEVHVVLDEQQPEKLPGFAGWETVQVKPRQKELTADLFEHLGLSIENYRKAVKLDPGNALYRLGLGWMLDQGALRASASPLTAATSAPATSAPTTSPSATQPATDRLIAEALEHYAKAVELALEGDLKRDMVMAGTDGAVSLEASRNALALMHRAKIDNAALSERMHAAYAKVNKLPRAITPIIFPLDTARPLAELIDESANVTFDLAGDGIDRNWPWVRENTGILVWDPSASGQIASGRQLFGSATWWMFWDNGYEALAALDSDGDSSLSGPELDGIGVWHDRDGDATSDDGEVTRATVAGIRAIAVRFDRALSGEMSNDRGITLDDGRVLPSYDWTPTGIPSGSFTSGPLFPRERVRLKNNGFPLRTHPHPGPLTEGEGEKNRSE